MSVEVVEQKKELAPSAEVEKITDRLDFLGISSNFRKTTIVLAEDEKVVNDQQKGPSIPERGKNVLAKLTFSVENDLVVLNKDEDLKLKDHKTLGYFRTGRDHPPTCAEPVEISEEDKPKPSVLLPSSEIDDLLLKPQHLGMRYKDAKEIQIADHLEFDKVNRAHFCRWLVDNEYFKNIGGEDKKWKRPDIALNGSVLSMLLCTAVFKPDKYWSFYAMKFNDVIFLTEAKIPGGFHTRASHAGYVFQKLVTGGNPKKEVIDGHQNLRAPTEVTLGKHQLLYAGSLTLSGVQENGDVFMVRSYQPKELILDRHWGNMEHRLEEKKFRFWCACVTHGAKGIILGCRDRDFNLRAIQTQETDQIWGDNDDEGAKEKKLMCFKVTHKILDFVKDQFTQNKNDRGIIKQFSFEWNTKKNDNPPDEENEDKNKNVKLWLKEGSIICSLLEDEEEKVRITDKLIPEWVAQATVTTTTSD